MNRTINFLIAMTMATCLNLSASALQAKTIDLDFELDLDSSTSSPFGLSAWEPLGDLELFAGDIIQFNITFADGESLRLTRNESGANTILVFGLAPAPINVKTELSAATLRNFAGDAADLAPVAAVNANQSLQLAQFDFLGDAGDSFVFSGISGQALVLSTVRLEDAFLGLNALNFDDTIIPPSAVPLPASGLALLGGLFGVLTLRRRRPAAQN